MKLNALFLFGTTWQFHKSLVALVGGALLLTQTLVEAQVPGVLSYQGRVTVSGSPFSGNGQFKFALVNANGGSSFWSNDGSSAAGSEPAAGVTLAVADGLYSVFLGVNMNSIPASVFDNSDVRLRVWFNDGTNGFQLMSPDQRIVAVGYAMRADSAMTAETATIALNVSDNVISTAKLVDGAVSATKIGDGAVTAAKISDGSITQAKLGFPISGVPGGAQEYATAGSHTFTVPAGVTKIMVEVWGAGAGVYAWHALSGGSGAYSRKSFSVTPGSQWTVTVGAGGAFVNDGPSPNGGDSSFVNASTPSIKLVSKGGRGATPDVEGLPPLALPDPEADIGRKGPTNAEVITGTVIPPLVILDDTEWMVSRILQVHQSSGGPFDPEGHFANDSPGQPGYVLIQW